MNFRRMAIGGAIMAILIAAGCSNKPTAPDPATGHGKAAIITINLSGPLTRTDADCFFITNSADSVMYELVFQTVKPPSFSFVTGSMIFVTGTPFNANIQDNRCGFTGPAVIVQKVSAQDVGNAPQQGRTIPAQ